MSYDEHLISMAGGDGGPDQHAECEDCGKCRAMLNAEEWCSDCGYFSCERGPDCADATEATK